VNSFSDGRTSLITSLLRVKKNVKKQKQFLKRFATTLAVAAVAVVY